MSIDPAPAGPRSTRGQRAFIAAAILGFAVASAYLALIIEARRLAPRQFKWRQPTYEFEKVKLPIDLLCGGDGIRRAIEGGVPLGRIERSWRPGLARFARARRPYLLYA